MKILDIRSNDIDTLLVCLTYPKMQHLRSIYKIFDAPYVVHYGYSLHPLDNPDATVQKILQRLELQVGIESLFIAYRGIWPGRIVMTREHDGAIVELGELLRQAAVHVFRVAAREIAATTSADEQGIPRDQMILNHKALRARGMTGRVQKGDVHVSDPCGVTAVDLDQIWPYRLHELRFRLVDVDFGLGAIEQCFDAVDMIEMAVGNENFRDRQVVFLRHLNDAIHVPGGVDNRHLTAVGVTNEVDVVRHRPQLNLFQIN